MFGIDLKLPIDLLLPSKQKEPPAQVISTKKDDFVSLKVVYV